MQPLLVHTRHFPPKKFYAITIFPFIFYNDKPLKGKDLQHEKVHIWQQLALLVVIFYLLYLLFWAINLIRYRNSFKAYREIPFERSAYSLQDLDNPSKRSMAFNWLKRLSK